jgi:non-specific serine/threonine protein kinase
LGQIASLQSDHETARAALADSIALSSAAGDTAAVAWSRATIAIWSLLTGRVDAAAELAEAAVSAVALSDHPIVGRPLVALALVRWTQGRKDEAAELFERCLASVPPGTSPWARGRALQFVGWTAHLDGEDDRALSALQDSAQLLAQIRAHRSQADSLDLLGCQWERRGDHRRAVRLLALAGRCRTIAGVPQHGYLERLTTPAHATAVAALGPETVNSITLDIAALPIRDVLVADPPDAGTTGPAGAPDVEASPVVVTARERQVAQLVARGMTNRQIGRALNISERTAERHVENLRSKLGVTSRAQIAAWATRELGRGQAP